MVNLALRSDHRGARQLNAANGVQASWGGGGPGGTSTMTAAVEHGTYALYGSFDHHARDGMTGTLTVR
jgi:hypothetical protein